MALFCHSRKVKLERLLRGVSGKVPQTKVINRAGSPQYRKLFPQQPGVSEDAPARRTTGAPAGVLSPCTDRATGCPLTCRSSCGPLLAEQPLIGTTVARHRWRPLRFIDLAICLWKFKLFQQWAVLARVAGLARLLERRQSLNPCLSVFLAFAGCALPSCIAGASRSIRT